MSSVFSTPLTSLITRFAPTPSGYLHLGNVYSLMLTWLIAHKAHGKILLRIDDLDQARYRPAYVQNVLDTLDFLGIQLDEAPSNVREFEKQHSQHLHLHQYQTAIRQLADQDLLFACDCSRKEMLANALDGQYPGTCRDKKLPLVDGYAWRVKTDQARPKTFLTPDGVAELASLDAVMRDFVIRRKDGLPAYQVTSVVDDLRLGVNWIVRGRDLLHSTAAQLFLADLLGASHLTHAIFYHHPLITGAQGAKLSKSQKASPVLAAFSSREELLGTLGLMIVGQKVSSLSEMLDRFSWDHLAQ